jgi:hypothetical protein
MQDQLKSVCKKGDPCLKLCIHCDEGHAMRCRLNPDLGLPYKLDTTLHSGMRSESQAPAVRGWPGLRPLDTEVPVDGIPWLVG